ncbi:hypothetical protein D3C76_1534610 [compost metagenome]
MPWNTVCARVWVMSCGSAAWFTCCRVRRVRVTWLRKACRLRRSLSLWPSGGLPSRASSGPKVASKGPLGPCCACSINGAGAWAISFCAELISESANAWLRVPAWPW